MWLLKRCGFSRYTQSILGDLTESYQSRQSTLWYGRQVAIAIVGSRWRGVRGHLDQGITFFRISGGHMRKAIVFVLAIVVGLSVFLLQAQAQFNVRAASDQPIAGWDRMDYDKSHKADRADNNLRPSAQLLAIARTLLSGT